MIRELRWYRGIRFGVVGGFVLTLVIFWTFLMRQLHALAPMTSECGCSVSPAHWPIGVVIGTGFLATAVMVLSVRFITAIVIRIKRHRQLIRDLSKRSRRLWHHGLTGEILVLEDAAQQAMTIGFFRPSIVVTSSLIRRLTGSELLTVLRHEQAHARSRDPLWSILLEAVGATFGWIGGLRVLINTAFSLREIIADAVATENYTRVVGLSGALYKLATSSAPRALPAFSPNSDRVQKLLDRSWHPPMRWWSWRRSAAIAVLIVAFFSVGQLANATAAATPTMPAEACWLRQVMCRGAASEIILMTPDGTMSRYGW